MNARSQSGGFNYRFSVIPAGAITDPQLAARPRALQVLCLLGRHTDDFGWCRRSQSKMAGELGCARSTVQGALDLLYETGWVERRLEGRGAAEANPDKPPFAAHSYRVRLDREDLPERVEQVAADRQEGVPDQPAPPGGARPAGTRVPDQPAPLEGIPFEPSERESAREAEPAARGEEGGTPDREAARGAERAEASDRDQKPGASTIDREDLLARLAKGHPTGFRDRLDMARAALDRMTDAEALEALDRLPAWVEAGLAKGRHLPPLQRYLGDRPFVWRLLPDPKAEAKARSNAKATAAAAAGDRMIKPVTRAWWWLLHEFVKEHGAEVGRRGSGAAQAFSRRFGGAENGRGILLETAEEKVPIEALAADLVGIPVNGEAAKAWARYYLRIGPPDEPEFRRGVRLPVLSEKSWIYVPTTNPPAEAATGLDNLSADELEGLG